MKQAFSQYPQILQKQIIIRLAAGIAALVATFFLWLYKGGLELMLPCICFAAVMLIGAMLLYIRCEEKSYVVIRGICKQIDHTGIRRRLKDIYVQDEQFTVRLVRPAMRIRSIKVGDHIAIYLAENAPVYEMEGCKVVYHPLAVEKVYVQTDKKQI